MDGSLGSVAVLLANPGFDGKISFFEAVEAVNNTGAGYTIGFSLTHGSTILYTSGIVDLTANNTIIDGDTNGDGKPDVVIDGPPDTLSLRILSSNNTLRNLAISGFSVDGSLGGGNNQILNNYIGTDVDGNVARPVDHNGIQIQAGAHHNTVQGNTIAGNHSLDPNLRNSGILIFTGAHDNIIRGNKIGLNVSGNALPNDLGIWVGGMPHKTRLAAAATARSAPIPATLSVEILRRASYCTAPARSPMWYRATTSA